MIDVVTPAQTRARRVSVLALLTLLALVAASPVDAAPSSDGAAQPAVTSYDLDARYKVSVHLDWDARRVNVKTVIDLVNSSGRPVDRLELNTVAAKLGSMKDLRVKVGGSRVRARVIGQTIRVPFAVPLAEGAAAQISVVYKARLRTTRQGRSWFFARLNGVAQLYRFIPWLSRVIPFGTQEHGEPFLTPISSRVEVTVSSDRRLVWATSGQQVARSGGRTFTYVAKQVRDFAIAASPSWKTVRGRSRDGQTTIFAHTRSASGRRLVSLAKEELARYEKMTGVPYPHPTYRVAESGGGLPMESPGLIWIPASRGPSEHPFLVSHETAHQWWYSAVGNDQSTNAFADEALADYFARKAHLSIRPSRCKLDRLDRDIRGYSTACYFEVIYVQGARFLENLRKDYGDAKFKRAIRRYTQDNRLDIASNARLLEAFRAEMGDKVLKRYHARFPSLY